MLALLFPLLASVALAINLAALSLHLPLRVGLGFLIVLFWIGFLVCLIFYRKDRVSQALERLTKGKEVRP